ncbi:hypothetical protein ALC57_09096 [Trachymyrmex cornetzi]|uniref:Uncharacterized protein n=1 Tax=Trachymyrmex cornetzi TaxID=471704 RepID=A0A151J650_9HYME|nr:hypothetical protein ALC57_09096 [Trachymyrmex cornetzi]
MNYDFLKINNEWFKNLSATHIPPEVQALLQLGQGFCLPNLNVDNARIEFIKDLEHNFFRCKIPNIKFRNKIFPLLKNMNNTTHTDIEKTIIALHSTTKTFCKNNPHIIFITADKGNVVVALDKFDYIRNMELLFSDAQTYSILKRNPANAIISDLLSLLRCWKRRDLISDSTQEVSLQCDVLIHFPVFKARYFLRIESLIFAISFATFSRSLLLSMSTNDLTERHAADNILAEKARKRITTSDSTLAAGVAKAVNNSKAAQRQLEELQRHNRVMESRGVYLAPSKRGRSVARAHYKDVESLRNLDDCNTIRCGKHAKNCVLQNVFKIFNWWSRHQEKL